MAKDICPMAAAVLLCPLHFAGTAAGHKTKTTMHPLDLLEENCLFFAVSKGSYRWKSLKI